MEKPLDWQGRASSTFVSSGLSISRSLKNLHTPWILMHLNYCNSLLGGALVRLLSPLSVIRLAYLDGAEVSALGWGLGGPRFQSHPRLTFQSCSRYQLNQLGSKAASESTFKKWNTCGVSNNRLYFFFLAVWKTRYSVMHSVALVGHSWESHFLAVHACHHCLYESVPPYLVHYFTLVSSIRSIVGRMLLRSNVTGMLFMHHLWQSTAFTK